MAILTGKALALSDSAEHSDLIWSVRLPMVVMCGGGKQAESSKTFQTYCRFACKNVQRLNWKSSGNRECCRHLCVTVVYTCSSFLWHIFFKAVLNPKTKLVCISLQVYKCGDCINIPLFLNFHLFRQWVLLFFNFL